MFGSKKRNYRKEVAKVLIGMAMPLDIELKTKNIYLLLRHSIDQYYSQNMMPIQAAMLISYQMVTNMHKNREIPHENSALDEFKEIFLAAADTMIEGEMTEMFSSEVAIEIRQMLYEMESCKIYSNDNITYGEILSQARSRRSISKELMARMGLN